ncbi:hypothetical protein [Actinoplanes sp. CA-252034]|uniref:hypothetical protein n=1 Tax=Actinoplanes sp. CA-252034 TaxID=3239906 RepID=UPI003D96A767
MTPARSVTASVVALGLAGALSAPAGAGHDLSASGVLNGPRAVEDRAPALDLASAHFSDPALTSKPAVPSAPHSSSASRSCDRPADYAAQSAAEVLRIDRLDLGAAGKKTSAGTGEAASLSTRERGGAAPAVHGVGLGEVRAVLIAKGPVNSAGAARILNGKVAGSKERNDQVVQKAPPVNPKGVTRRTGSKRFGPVQVGAGSLSARATWAHGMDCGNAAGDTSTASAGITRFTIAGGGNGSLVRVPEKITSRTSTALRLRGGAPQSVGSATISAGRISLVDNEVRLRVLQAPELRAAMTSTGQSRVDYRAPVVEVSGRNGKKTRLSTPGEHIDITLSDEVRPLESMPPRLDTIGGLPLPKVSGLPVAGTPEVTPAPDPKPGSTLRITLGKVRQSTGNNAVAARATAIRVTLTRNVDNGDGHAANAPSGVVADLGIGMLEAAAVAPSGKVSGRSGGTGQTSSQPGSPVQGSLAGNGNAGHDKTGHDNTSGHVNTGHGKTGHGNAGHDKTSHDNTSGHVDTGHGKTGHGNAGHGNAGHGATPGHGAFDQDGAFGRGGTPGSGAASAGKAAHTGALPVTGARVVSLLLAGFVMIVAGAAAIILGSRRRKRS